MLPGLQLELLVPEVRSICASVRARASPDAACASAIERERERSHPPLTFRRFFVCAAPRFCAVRCSKRFLEDAMSRNAGTGSGMPLKSTVDCD